MTIENPNNYNVAKLEATQLRGNLYAVRPAGQLGTCGFYPTAWDVQYIKAKSRLDAMRKAKPVKVPITR